MCDHTLDLLLPAQISSLLCSFEVLCCSACLKKLLRPPERRRPPEYVAPSGGRRRSGAVAPSHRPYPSQGEADSNDGPRPRKSPETPTSAPPRTSAPPQTSALPRISALPRTSSTLRQPQLPPTSSSIPHFPPPVPPPFSAPLLTAVCILPNCLLYSSWILLRAPPSRAPARQGS